MTRTHGTFSACQFRPARRSAFTMLELILGLSISALIGACLVAFASGATTAWQFHGQTGAGEANRSGGRVYMERSIRTAAEVGYVAGGSVTEPATLLLWSHDMYQRDGVLARDRVAQRAELLLLRFDPDTQQLKLFRPRPWSLMTAAQRTEAATALTTAQLMDKSTADAFSTAGWVQSFVLLGAESSVTDVQFTVDRTTFRPIVTYELALLRDGIPLSRSGALSVRSRSGMDNWTGNDLYQRVRDESVNLSTLTIPECTDVAGSGDGGGDDEDPGDFDLFG